ncbi:uncharacterized protein LOC142356788 [Convolutriloba macropyga]|uniref:uncharacterized protein LOC142356788 n=1 Tax=Convolutriloba macropyga TaxID=536237 RepID=UPI003F52373E
MALVVSKSSALQIEGATFVALICDWWNGRLTATELLHKIANMASRIYDKFFNSSQKEALKNAYTELSLPQGTKDKTLIKKKYNDLALIHHPDKGGDKEKFEEITVARDTILASLSE